MLTLLNKSCENWIWKIYKIYYVNPWEMLTSLSKKVVGAKRAAPIRPPSNVVKGIWTLVNTLLNLKRFTYLGFRVGSAVPSLGYSIIDFKPKTHFSKQILLIRKRTVKLCFAWDNPPTNRYRQNNVVAKVNQPLIDLWMLVVWFRHSLCCGISEPTASAVISININKQAFNK